MFTRTLLTRPDGTNDTTTEVTWIQGDRLYCDLRRSLDGTHVEGFAGPVVEHDAAGVIEWVHTIDLASGDGIDAGTFVRLDPTTLVEHGLYEEYVEHWRIAVGPEIDGSVQVREHALNDPSDGARGVLVRVGDRFGFAHTGGQSPAEVCIGSVVEECWTVTHSSRASRVGTDFAPVTGDGTLTTTEPSGNGGLHRRHWLIDRSDLPSAEEN